MGSKTKGVVLSFLIVLNIASGLFFLMPKTAEASKLCWGTLLLPIPGAPEVCKMTISWFGSWAENATVNAIKALLVAIETLLAWLLGFVGLVFDIAVAYTLDSSLISGLSSVTIAWATIRDVLNMAFIFIMLWIAIGTILGLSSVNTKKCSLAL